MPRTFSFRFAFVFFHSANGSGFVCVSCIVNLKVTTSRVEHLEETDSAYGMRRELAFWVSGSTGIVDSGVSSKLVEYI